MPTDKLYQDILEKLRTETLDDTTFEKIAVRVANYHGVRVIPMPGGQDAGYDGAIVDVAGHRLPGALVATIQENGIANLRKNLRRHADAYPEAAKIAFFATTRLKTNRQKANLTKEAHGMGYTLSGIVDESDVAEYLYFHPSSCQELLGFRGVPSALSSLPPRRRPHWNVDLVARDTALDRLRSLTGDAMLVGIPGSGKTSLLSQASSQNLGLFARTADRDRLAPDLREHRPRSVFVDGLENPLATVRALVSLREESGIHFDIVVTGWDEDEGIVELLGLGPNHRIRLDRLELDELVELVRRVGLVGPRELIHNIVHQAGGSPGLAVTLAMACRDGNVGEVVTGRILLRQVRTALRDRPLDDRKAEHALAAIAVGGNAGMKPDQVAKAIDMSSLELHRLLEDIESGGIIRPWGYGNVSVQPEHLRAALVATNFYRIYPISLRPWLDIAPNRAAALHTLIMAVAAHDGPEPSELRALLTVQDSGVFEAYASLGPEQCRWTIAAQPEHLIAVSRVALHHIPEEVLPLLIEASRGDARQLHSTPRQPLRIVHDWCAAAQPGAGQVVKRREMTVKAALRYLDQTGDVHTAVHAFTQALTTEHEASYADPGRGLTITLEWSVITPGEIEAVGGLWRRCLNSLRGRGELPWRMLLEAARNAASVRPVNDEERVAESRAAARRLRNTMARDILELAESHPGVAHEARQVAREHEGWPVETDRERWYSLLFGENFSENYHEREADAAAQLTVLAEAWSRGSPDEVMDVLARLSAASRDVGHQGMDRRPALGYQLADRVEVLPWLRVAIEHNADYAVVMPLLGRAIRTHTPGWVDAARSCIGTRSEAAAVEAALLSGGPPDLMADIVPLLPKYTGLVGQVCIRGEVSPDALQILLSHQDDYVAAEAAIHLWHGTKGNIEDDIKSAWRGAVLRSNHKNPWIGDILSTDPALAFEWLKRLIESDDWRTLMQDRVVQEAARLLTEDQRVELLGTVTKAASFHDLVGPLFGGSVEVFTRVLGAGGREALCLMALERPKDEAWADFVGVAQNHGISVDDLARASNWVSGFNGPESASLQERIERVAPFLEDPREPVRRVARRMTELLAADRDRALTVEHEERVWGR